MHVKEKGNGKSTLYNLNEFYWKDWHLTEQRLFLFFTDVLANIKSSNSVQRRYHLKTARMIL